MSVETASLEPAGSRPSLARRSLDRLLEGLGRVAEPIVKARSRRGILPGTGTTPLPGLVSACEVHFDDVGVPHVRARTEADAFRAQGYCHARDRFFQMDMLRRVLSGRLSEIVGERPLGSIAMPPFSEKSTTVATDHLLRTLGLRRSALRVWDEVEGEGRMLLAAYVQGVNAAVAQMARRRPFEHRLLRLPLVAWSPVDSILIAKGMALGLSFKWRAAPLFTALSEQLQDAPEMLAPILPPVPGQAAVTIARCITHGIGKSLSFLPIETPAQGSNAWLVGGGRTASGKPLLASDPHLELSLPGIWYLASLTGGRYAAVGATLPGLPGVVIGRTPTLAWGLTNAMLDDADLWVEKLDEQGACYEVDGAWRDLEVETQSIARRRAGPHEIRIRRTHRGPVISDAFPEYEGPALSLRMTLHEANPDMDAFLGLGRARSVREAVEVAGCYGAPAQNLLAADTAGEAAYQMIGQVPMRSFDAHPALPRDGTRSETDWTGFVDRRELPALSLGPEDQLVSANQAPVGPDYPHYLSHLFEPEYRSLRIAVQLAGRCNLVAADMAALQLDAVNIAWKRFHDAVLAPHADGVLAARPDLAALLDTLLAWQGDESTDARGAVPWHLLYHHLVRRTFEPRLGRDLVRAWCGVVNLVDAALYDAFEHEDSPWAPPAERVRLLAGALEDTQRHLAASGLDLDSPWGAWHTLSLDHPAGSARALARTFNRGPYPIAGGPYTVSSGQYLHSRPGPMLAGASYRQVVDLGDIANARMITFGGQSGHVGSPHYDDLTPLWRAGQTLPMRLETLPEGADVLRLVPA